MTKEERLKWLKEIEKDIYVCSLESTFIEDAKSCAIHSAIEELEQESCEDWMDVPSDEMTIEQARQAVKDLRKKLANTICEDAISRQAVLDMAYDMSEIDGEHFTEPCMVVEVEDIEKLPSIATTREHGEWIDIVDGISYTWATCNKCNGRASMAYKYYKFCPNCGADMRGKQK